MEGGGGGHAAQARQTIERTKERVSEREREKTRQKGKAFVRWLEREGEEEQKKIEKNMSTVKRPRGRVSELHRERGEGGSEGGREEGPDDRN